MKPTSILIDGTAKATKWPSFESLADLILDAAELCHCKKATVLHMPVKQNLLVVSALETHLALHWDMQEKIILFSLDVFSYDPRVDLRSLSGLVIRNLGEIETEGVRRYQRW